MNKLFHDAAWNELMEWAWLDRKTFRRIMQLIRDTERDPFGGIGKPEPLSGDLSGWWSRRIDGEHRIVYRVRNGVLEILQCWGHYEH